MKLDRERSRRVRADCDRLHTWPDLAKFALTWSSNTPVIRAIAALGRDERSAGSHDFVVRRDGGPHRSPACRHPVRVNVACLTKILKSRYPRGPMKKSMNGVLATLAVAI